VSGAPVSQLGLAVVEYVAWFNHARPHSAFGDIPPVEFEQAAGASAPQPPEPAVDLGAVHHCDAGTTPAGSSPIYGVTTTGWCSPATSPPSRWRWFSPTPTPTKPSTSRRSRALA
jgi:hypothetical protein